MGFLTSKEKEEADVILQEGTHTIKVGQFQFVEGLDGQEFFEELDHSDELDIGMMDLPFKKEEY
jgi:hypothetical protein